MTRVATDPSDIPSSFMQCRAFRRHDEAFVNDTVTTGRGGRVIEFTRHAACGRCGYASWVTYSVPSMEVVRRKTAYPDFYQLKGGLSAPEGKIIYLERKGYNVGMGERRRLKG